MKRKKCFYLLFLLCLCLSGVTLFQCGTDKESPYKGSTTKPDDKPDDKPTVQSNFHILSYNILNGWQNNATRQAQGAAWIKNKQVDIAGFQELTYFNSSKLANFSSQCGHDYSYFVEYPNDHPINNCPVGLTSKYPMENIQAVSKNMEDSYLYAKIKGIHIITLHLGANGYAKRRAEIDILLAHLATIPKTDKIAVFGDFNSWSPDDAAYYSAQYIANRVEEDKQNPGRENCSNGGLDYYVIQSMKNAGLKDAYWLLNTKWYLTGNTKTNIRFDYMFLSPELAKYAVSAEHVIDSDTDVMSDHYPLLVKFQLPN
jgi:exodeoxyribonuclease-3